MRLRALLSRLTCALDPRRLLPTIVGLAVLLLASDALGRAGGGQHYSGGSSSSGGSGSSGSGGILDLLEIVFWIFRLTFAYPHFMLPLWLVVIIAVVITLRSQPSSASRREITRMDVQRLRPRQDVNEALGGLQQSDPSFDVDAFFDRTKKVFLDVQESWFRRDLEKTRVYMSDGLYRRFTTLLSLMKLENQRNGLADATILNARMLEVSRTPAFDCLAVQIRASVRDVDVAATLSDDEARAKAKRANMEDFTEIWTFVRRRGVASRKPGDDITQGKCPSCGAAFSGGATNRCAYCNAVVNSGNYDWVLSEITQPSEYLPHDAAAPGFDALAEKDPDAAPELLRDRGLLLFWKWLEAWAFSDATQVQKLATPTGLRAINSEIEEAKGRGASIAVRLAAVGGTSIAAVEVDSNGFDRVHVDVRWSAVMATTKAGARLDPRPYRSIVTMVRAADAKTDRGTGLSNERCGNCGAPLTNSDSTKCDYCGHDFTGAAKEWQLEGLVPYDQWNGPRVTTAPRSNAAFATGNERRRMLQVMVAIVRADGVVDKSEMKLLKDCSTRWNIPWKDVQGMLDGDADALMNDLRPQSPAQSRAFLSQIIMAAKVDGRIDRRERALIFSAAAKLNVNEDTVNELLDES
jgi:predicted lipid-binding transport protein (Tim44 family)/uncharacterized tellurite resistance protein B-like protein